MSNGKTAIETRRYKSGSIIYFEGDRSDVVYVLKSGRVVLSSVKLDTGDEVKEDVRQGEFFGVKSALGKYPREETAQTIGDTFVLILPLAEFEKIVLRNVNVVRKMLKVFSNQLRRVHRMVRSVLGENTAVKPDLELFRIGEYYNSVGSFKHAEYVYNKYLEYYPDGEYSSIANQKLRSLSSGGASDSFSEYERSGAGMDDFGFDDTGASSASTGVSDEPSFDIDGDSTKSSPLSNEMDDFLADDSSPGDDPFGSEDKSGGPEYIKEMYDNAMEFMRKDMPDKALELYEKIMSRDDVKNREEQALFESAHLNAAKCYLNTSRIKEAFALLAQVVNDFPESKSLKESYYYLGVIFEKARKPDKAVAYYNRVLNMQPHDQVSINAMNQIKKIQSAG